MLNNLSNKKLFREVKELQLPMGQYVLFGSAPLGIRGLRDCHDIDIIVTKNLWNKYKNDDWESKIGELGGESLQKGDIFLFRDLLPNKEIWNISKIISEADIIDELPFIKLEYVIQWKKLVGREKDLQDLKLIEEYLK